MDQSLQSLILRLLPLATNYSNVLGYRMDVYILSLTKARSPVPLDVHLRESEV